MIRIAVVDSSSESRGRILDQLDSFLRSEGSDSHLLPRVNLKPVSPQELKFNAAPDVCLIGPQLVEEQMTEISRIKKLFPSTPIMVWLSQRLSNLSVIEQVARQGADDVLTFDATPIYFFRRLLLCSRKAVHQNSGKLVIVDGGKGGVGVTTVTAALAEQMSALGKKVVTVDCDFETQDLSRFLQARPFLNENLRLLLEEERVVSEESVEQCLSLVWEDDHSLKCMAPVSEGDDLYDPHSRLPRTFLSILEVLDSINDVVIIDIGCARSALQKMLYRVADKLIFVVSDDPASLYASVDKLTKARSQLSAGAQLTVIENCVGLNGLGNKLLRKEFSRAARLEEAHWAPEPIAYCKVGQRWPGSGSTFFTQAKATSTKSFEKLVVALGLLDQSKAQGSFTNLFNKLKFRATKERDHLGTSNSIVQNIIKSEGTLSVKSKELPNETPVSGARPKLISHVKVSEEAPITLHTKVDEREFFDIDAVVGIAQPR